MHRPKQQVCFSPPFRLGLLDFEEQMSRLRQGRRYLFC